MKFLMQGIEIDTTKVKYKPALEDVLLMVTKTYYPDIKLSKVYMILTRRIILSSLRFTEIQNIIFLVILKMWMPN